MTMDAAVMETRDQLIARLAGALGADAVTEGDAPGEVRVIGATGEAGGELRAC